MRPGGVEIAIGQGPLGTQQCGGIDGRVARSLQDGPIPDNEMACVVEEGQRGVSTTAG